VQHLELTREIVRRFATAGPVFPSPSRCFDRAAHPQVDSKAKMSKSLNNAIGLI
jgi:tryptophanyl-tRNA synthetase